MFDRVLNTPPSTTPTSKDFKPAGKYLDSYVPTWASPFEEKTFNKITSFFPAGNYMLKV